MNITVKPRFYFVLAVCAAMVFLLFFAESDLIPTRSWKHAWNLGHILCFLFVGYTVYAFFPAFSTLRLRFQFVAMLLLSGILGSLIEFIQLFVGRQASLQDVLLDIVGGLVAITLYSPQVRKLRLFHRLAIAFVVTVFLILTAKNLLVSLWDEYQSYHQFPVLADFESVLEMGRWDSAERIGVTNEVTWLGRRSLKVRLTPRRYSGVELLYFPRDWSDYSRLAFHVFNPETIAFVLTVSLYDEQHIKNHFAYFDRYTGQFVVHQGWNEVVVSLAEAQSAPRTRAMDMSRIRAVRMFTTPFKQTKEIYIDAVRLEK